MAHSEVPSIGPKVMISLLWRTIPKQTSVPKQAKVIRSKHHMSHLPRTVRYATPRETNYEPWHFTVTTSYFKQKFYATIKACIINTHLTLLWCFVQVHTTCPTSLIDSVYSNGTHLMSLALACHVRSISFTFSFSTFWIKKSFWLDRLAMLGAF